MQLEKNKVGDIIELRKFLIDNKFPQSFIDLLEDYFVNNLLTMAKIDEVFK